MPTVGVPDVDLKLAELFWGWGGSLIPLEQRNVVALIAAEVARTPENDGTSFVGRFLKKRLKVNDKLPLLDVQDADIVEGLLKCLHHGWRSEAGWDMKHGIWDHFKGGIYRSERVERCADTDEPRVSYLSMLFGTPHSRRAIQWNEVVQWPDGKYRSRFIYRGPDLRTPPPSFKVPSPTEASM